MYKIQGKYEVANKIMYTCQFLFCNVSNQNSTCKGETECKQDFVDTELLNKATHTESIP